MNGRRPLVFAGLLVTLGIILIFWPTPRETEPPQPSPTPSAADSASPGSSDHDQIEDWDQARQSVAEKFIQAYTNTTRIPIGKVEGVLPLAPSGHFRVDFASGESLVGTLTEGPAGGWLVSSIEPIRTPAPVGNDL